MSRLYRLLPSSLLGFFNRPQSSAIGMSGTLSKSVSGGGGSGAAPGYRVVSQERLDAWATLKATGHPLWNSAVANAALTGTGSERYGDVGMLAAIVAVTNDDASYAAKAINKLRGLSAGASANTIREEYTERAIMVDMLGKWLTPADRAIIDPILDYWPHDVAAGTLGQGDSDAWCGEGLGAIVWDLVQGRTPNWPTVISTMTAYVARAAGGTWLEGSQYNHATLTLVALANDAITTATGTEAVPGVTQLLYDAGETAAYEITQDGATIFQWGDDQYPRGHRRYKTNGFLWANKNPYAQWAFNEQVANYWPWSNDHLAEKGLYLAQTTVTPQPPPANSVHLSTGMGHLYWRRSNGATSFIMMSNKSGVDHTNIAPQMDFQVYKNGWLLTRPIGYGIGVHERAQNNPNYAVGAIFQGWSRDFEATGANWVAMGGTNSGQYWVVAYPSPPDFLTSGNRVVIMAEVSGEEVVIVRDEFTMVDPRSFPSYPSGYRNTSTYPHQARITEYDGKFLSFWHMPASPSIAGDTLTWTAPNGTPVSLKSFSDGTITYTVVNETTVFGSEMVASEKKFQTRINTDATVLFSVFHTGSLTVSRSGNDITVGGQTWTVTSSGVTSS